MNTSPNLVQILPLRVQRFMFALAANPTREEFKTLDTLLEDFNRGLGPTIVSAVASNHITSLRFHLTQYMSAWYHEDQKYPALYNWAIVPSRDFTVSFPSYVLIGRLLSPRKGDTQFHHEFQHTWDKLFGETDHVKATASTDLDWVHLTTSPIQNFYAHKTGRMFAQTKNTMYELIRFQDNIQHTAMWNHLIMIDQLHANLLPIDMLQQ